MPVSPGGCRYLFFHCGPYQSLYLQDVMDARRKDKDRRHQAIVVDTTKGGESLPKIPKRRMK